GRRRAPDAAATRRDLEGHLLGRRAAARRTARATRTRARTTGPGCATAGTARPGRAAGATGTRSTAAAATEAAEADRAAAAADVHAADVTLAHIGVPALAQLALVVRVDAGDVDHVRVLHAGDRAVTVVEHRGLVDGVAVIVVAPLVLDRREVHRLGIHELRALDVVVRAHAEAGEQQVGDRAGLADRVVLVVHEGGVLHLVEHVVVLVAADREVRKLREGQAAAQLLLLGGHRVAHVLALAHEQRVGHQRGVLRAPQVARGLGEADAVVGHLQALPHAQD